MILKKQLVMLVVLMFCSSVYSQMPIHKIEEDSRKNISYKLQSRKSDLILKDSLNFKSKLNNEKAINDFMMKNKSEIDVYISSLNVVKAKKGNLTYNRLKNSEYAPDILLNNFLKKNISIESFSNMSKMKACKIGIYMFYNFEKSLYGIELVELKDNKYYLIYRLIQNIDSKN